MKTSLVLLALIVLNTSALLSEPISLLIKGMDTWLLIVFEVILLVVLYLHNTLKGLNEIANVDLSGIELFVCNPKDSTQDRSKEVQKKS